jgi:hypothetical protein
VALWLQVRAFCWKCHHTVVRREWGKSDIWLQWGKEMIGKKKKK